MSDLVVSGGKVPIVPPLLLYLSGALQLVVILALMALVSQSSTTMFKRHYSWFRYDINWHEHATTQRTSSGWLSIWTCCIRQPLGDCSVWTADQTSDVRMRKPEQSIFGPS